MNPFQFKLRFYKKLIFIAVNTFILIIIIFSIFIIIFHVRKYNENARILAKLGSSKDEPIIFGKPCDGCIKIAVTCCGEDVIEQTLIMIKSALISTNHSIHFIIFADYVKSAINESILEWPKNVLNKISFEILSISFPKVKDSKFWKFAFKPCSAQRLFYPILLPHHELIIHIDSDAIFLSPVEELWSYFDRMNGSQIAALATEDMNLKTNWNLNHRTAPFPSKYGLNAGIMLMNLARMREINFFSELEPIAQKYKGLLPWFDQDVINVYFYQHPEKYLMLPCKWNFLTAHCNDKSFCDSAEKDGIALLHGSKGCFHDDYELAFRAIYLSFKNYLFGSDLRKNLIEYIEEYLSYIESNCSKNSKIFTKNLEKILQLRSNSH